MQQEDDCPWENGELGNDARYVRVAPASVSRAVDKALGLTPITFRVDAVTARRLTRQARMSGLCVQAYARQALVEKLDKKKRLEKRTRVEKRSKR